MKLGRASDRHTRHHREAAIHDVRHGNHFFVHRRDLSWPLVDLHIGQLPDSMVAGSSHGFCSSLSCCSFFAHSARQA